MKIFIKPNIVEYENCLILTKENEKHEIDYEHAIVLEDVAKFIFLKIKQGKTSEEIEEEMVKSFDVSKSRAKADLKNFINQLIEADVAYVK